MLRTIGLASALFLAATVVPSQANDEVREVNVRFAPGASGTILRDRITGQESVLYRIGAEAGQRMAIRLRSNNRATYFNIYEPGRGPGDQALATGQLTGPMVPDLNRFDAALPASGTYTVAVFMVRAAARRGERSDYRLDIRIPGPSTRLDRPVERDFADGLAGGPDFFAVSGVAAGDRLNLRAEPSAQATILVRLRNGAVVRNLGCRMVGGQRWCRIETTSDVRRTGWAAGRFLIEGAAPAARSAPATGGDRTVPGTNFNATGSLPCARHAGQPMQNCRFGVVRRGGGAALVTVFWPDGGTQSIEFSGGRPVAIGGSASERLDVSRNGDLYILSSGTERFEIPEAAVFGG